MTSKKLLITKSVLRRLAHMDRQVPVKIVLTHKDAQPPIYKTDGDAGADVRSVEEITIGPGNHAVVDLGFRMELPPGWEMQVRSRSGLAAKHGIFVLNSPGTIDSGYRGPCKVILQNMQTRSYTVKVGERIAQFVIKRAPTAAYSVVTELSDSERGSGGFGSTGKH
jgi:dUTP pyrophosphatase